VSENKVLKEIFGLQKDEVNGQVTRLHKEELNNYTGHLGY
jgi:hypothetical protein